MPKTEYIAPHGQGQNYQDHCRAFRLRMFKPEMKSMPISEINVQLCPDSGFKIEIILSKVPELNKFIGDMICSFKEREIGYTSEMDFEESSLGTSYGEYSLIFYANHEKFQLHKFLGCLDRFSIGEMLRRNFIHAYQEILDSITDGDNQSEKTQNYYRATAKEIVKVRV